MLFTSYGFVAFLCALFVVYYVVPKKTQWWLLLAASYVFYAFAGLECLAFILVTTVSSYFIARIMDGMRRKEENYLSVNRDKIIRSNSPEKQFSSLSRTDCLLQMCRTWLTSL